MKILKFLQNPHFQLIASVIAVIVAMVYVQSFVGDHVELTLRWSLVIAGALVACLVVSAYAYLLFGKYKAGSWDRRFLWSVNILKILSFVLLVAMIIATYVAFMASGYQLGGLLVPWMEILIVMLLIIPIPMGSYWAMVNLKQTFNKRYAWTSLYIHLIPLTIVLALAYSGNWLPDLYSELKIYLGI